MDANFMISARVIIMLIVQAVFSVVPLIAAWIFWKKKHGTVKRPFLMGIVAFFVFAVIGQQALHALVLDLNSTLGAYIEARPWLNALYVGLAAGIFEETARLLMFRTALREEKDREYAVAYGIGHGGTECIVALGLSVLSNLMMAATLNSGTLAEVIAEMSAEELATLSETVNMINGVSVSSVLVVMLERVCMFALQISLSVFIFTALHQKKMWLYPVAILVHAGVELVPALYQAGYAQIWLVEVLLILYVAAVAIPAVRMYRTLPSGDAVEVDQFGRPIKKKK